MLKKHVYLATVLAVLAAAFAFVIAGVPAAQAAAPTRIMALGDSITGSPGCWRALLWQRLTNSGFTDIDFVGTLPPQGCGFPYDGENEGHGGFLATNVANGNQLPPWLAATQPDVVIMHFGTNDVWSNIAPATILAAFSRLVDQMRASNPSMKILVAQIIPMNPANCGDCNQRVIAFNAAIPGWAAGKTTAASPITVVNQFAGFNTATDTYDGVHPNAAGDQKISNTWYPPLTAVLNGATQPPDTQAPTAPGTPIASATCNTVTLTWPASSDANGIAQYRIERAAGATSTSFTQIGTSTTTTFTDTGRAANTTYRYRVRAADPSGNLSPYSNIVNVLTPNCTDTSPPTTPGAPTTSNVTNASVTLSWGASSDNTGVSGYDVFRATGSGSFSQVGTATTTTFTNTGLTAATTYRYQVRARDAAGNVSAFTAPVSVTTTGGTTTTTTPPPGGCTATYRQVNAWPGNIQGEVTVRNTSSVPINWRVTLTFNGTVTQIWGGRTTQTASPYTVTNETWNGNLAPNATTTFGFIATVSGTPAVTVSCTVG
jgi:lysophospholipase L1-like esterase/chitodextrinase